jgi:PAS domain S-box-containing protein
LAVVDFVKKCYPGFRTPTLLIIFGGLWITLSDKLLSILVSDIDTLSRIQTVKGWIFVLVIAALAYFLGKTNNRELLAVNRQKELEWKRYQVVIEEMSDFFTQVGPDGTFIFMNTRAADFFEISPDNAKGLNAFSFVHPDDRKKTETWFDDCLRDKTQNSQIENRQVAGSGKTYHLAWSCSFHFTEKGGLDFVNSIARDITTQKEAELALIENLKLKSELISTTAHELNTPVTAIMGSAELLLKREELELSEEHFDELLGIIEERSEALSSIVEDFLDLGKIHAGQKIPVDVAPCEITDFVEQAAKRFKGMFTERRFITQCALKQPEKLMIDEHRMNRALNNLITNAIKYSPEHAPITIVCDKQGENFTIAVKDEGIGMDEHVLDRVFDKFFRADSSDTAVGGFGLGLNIAADIVNNHGGSIHAKSEKGAGSTFTISIPQRLVV